MGEEPLPTIVKKEYLPFNDTALKEHFLGKSTIGIYPLLSDNTSFFIAADFDEANWQESILRLYKVCQEVELPAVIERSRSGNGGHLWLFEENIPCIPESENNVRPPITVGNSL